MFSRTSVSPRHHLVLGVILEEQVLLSGWGGTIAPAGTSTWNTLKWSLSVLLFHLLVSFAVCFHAQNKNMFQSFQILD